MNTDHFYLKLLPLPYLISLTKHFTKNEIMLHCIVLAATVSVAMLKM